MIANEEEFMGVARRATQLSQQILSIEDASYPPGLSDRETFWLDVELADNKARLDLLRNEMVGYDLEHNLDRKGSWIPLYSNRRIWLEDPRPQDICLTDIAHPLANICRYGGHSSKFFSVAQHCVLGSWMIDVKYAKAFLMHDAAEAYLGDLIKPLKNILAPIYNPLEERMMGAIAAKYRFSLDGEAGEKVKYVDNFMMATEIRDVTNAGILKHPTDISMVPKKEFFIKEFWTPEQAEREFLNRFEVLFGDPWNY